MMKVKMEIRSLKFVITVQSILLCFLSLSTAEVQILTEGNWTDMLTGEWLVKFYATWCPACQSLSPTWDRLGQRSFDLNMKFAKIDVTENAVLSGRFFIVALPTIYHVKDGIFHHYKGQRSELDIVNFVRDELWKEMDPVPWYLSPTSVHMAVVGMFFQFSITIRDVHSAMTNEYGVPVWGSYIIFAVATILLGLLIGLLIVFLCDAVHLTRSRRRVTNVHSRSEATKQSANSVGDADDDEDDYDLPDDTHLRGDSNESPSKPSGRSEVGESSADSAADGVDNTGLRRRGDQKSDS